MSKKTNNSLVKIIIVAVVGIAIAVVAKGLISNMAHSPKAVIKEFESAYNDKNIVKIVDCLDPDTQALIGNVLDIASYFVSDEQMLEMANNILDLAQNTDDKTLQNIKNSTLELEVIDVEKDGNYVYVTVNYSFYYDDQELLNDQITIKTIKVDGKWYIDAKDMVNSLI